MILRIAAVPFGAGCEYSDGQTFHLSWAQIGQHVHFSLTLFSVVPGMSGWSGVAFGDSMVGTKFPGKSKDNRQRIGVVKQCVPCVIESERVASFPCYKRRSFGPGDPLERTRFLSSRIFAMQQIMCAKKLHKTCASFQHAGLDVIVVRLVNGAVQVTDEYVQGFRSPTMDAVQNVQQQVCCDSVTPSRASPWQMAR